MDPMTKGEALAVGLEQLKQGLQMIRQVGGPKDLLKILVGSQAAVSQIKEVIATGTLRPLVYALVASRNSRLSAETVHKVVDDFLDVLTDLAQPFPHPEPIGQREADHGQP